MKKLKVVTVVGTRPEIIRLSRVIARLDEHWLTLDNRRMAMIEDTDERNTRPLFVIDQHGIMQYVDTPLLANLQDQDRTPLMALIFTARPSPISTVN